MYNILTFKKALLYVLLDLCQFFWENKISGDPLLENIRNVKINLIPERLSLFLMYLVSYFYLYKLNAQIRPLLSG
jgi:hypothetical protein